MTISLIFAVSSNNVIGQNNRIPWHYPADLKRFKRLTLGSTIIMGRKTFESIGNKPLPGRRNIVVSSKTDLNMSAGMVLASSISHAIDLAQDQDIWFIGGSQIYQEAMSYVDFIDVTHVPDQITGDNLIYAPTIDPDIFEAQSVTIHEDDPRLTRQVWSRRNKNLPR